MRDRRGQGHQAQAAPAARRAVALRRQDAPGPAEDAAAPLGAGRRRRPGEGRRRRARRVPIALRDVPDLHRLVEEGRPRQGRRVPRPGRRPRPGPPDRREGAGVQAQGGPRSERLRDLPGPPRHLGRPPARGGGPQGGPDHRGAAGLGQAQGAMAVQPGHGPVGGSALRRIRVEAPRPGTGRDRSDRRRPHVPAHARVVDSSSAPRLAQVPDRGLGAVVARRVSTRRDGPARPPDRAGVPPRGLAVHPHPPVPDVPEGRAGRRSRTPVVGPPDRLAGRLRDARRGRDGSWT